eukprot:2790201-Rhodomonas_salina.3
MVTCACWQHAASAPHIALQAGSNEALAQDHARHRVRAARSAKLDITHHPPTTHRQVAPATHLLVLLHDHLPFVLLQILRVGCVRSGPGTCQCHGWRKQMVWYAIVWYEAWHSMSWQRPRHTMAWFMAWHAIRRHDMTHRDGNQTTKRMMLVLMLMLVLMFAMNHAMVWFMAWPDIR